MQTEYLFTWGVVWSNGSIVTGILSGSIRLWRLKSSAGVDLRLGTSSLVDLTKVGLGSDNVKEGGFCGMKQSSEQILWTLLLQEVTKKDCILKTSACFNPIRPLTP